MDSETQRRLRRLERERTAFAGRLSGWSAEKLHFRSDPRVWSALDILDHLVRVDESVLRDIRQNLAAPAGIGVRDRVRTFMVNCVMLSPLRVKVPATANEVMPQPANDAVELVSTWNQTHRMLANLAADLTASQRSSGVFRHPVAGWMSFRGALRFLSTHLRHHGYQLRRVEKAAAGEYVID